MFGMMRREFISLLGGAAAAWPHAVMAQPAGDMRRISVLMGVAENDPEGKLNVSEFVQGLKELGWIEGRNIRIDYRWGGGDAARMRPMAKEMVELKPEAILAFTTGVTAALRAETRTVPIVFVLVSDPIGQGFVETLARPGGNMTGFTNLEPTMGGKWLELIKEIAPTTAQVSAILNPETAPGRGSLFLGSIEAASRLLGLQAIVTPVHTTGELESALAALGRGPGNSIIVSPDVFTLAHRDLIIALAARHRLPAVYTWRFATESGGLLSYGVDFNDVFRRAAAYVDRILRGTKPADLPVQQPTKFELMINLKTAKALGLTVPPTLLARADEVIE